MLFFLKKINFRSPKGLWELFFKAAIIFGVFFGIYVFAQSPDNPVTIPGTNFEVCTGIVDQPACYTGESPTPTLNWTFTSPGSSHQVSYWVQVDDSGNDAGNYPSPEVNTGEVLSSNTYHTVDPGQLQFNTTYYWKVAVKDNFGTWSGWTCADVTFTTNPPCNSAPTATNLSVSSGDSATYCGGTAAHYFSWIYSDSDGDDESQFQFQVDNNNDFSSPEVDRTYSGLSNPSPTTNNQSVTVSLSPGSDQIAYNTTYYWRVQVWDDQGNASGWTEGPSFTTEAHPYPSIDFNWSPQNPSAEEDVLFADQSICYDADSYCDSWFWTFEDGNPASSSQRNPTIQFTSNGSKQVTLQVTDSDGYTCSDSKTVNVRLKLPGWKEILPW